MSTLGSADSKGTDSGQQDAFQREHREKRAGLVSEYLEFLNQSKKWWLIPVVLLILLIGLLIVLGGTALGPFIYPLF